MPPRLSLPALAPLLPVLAVRGRGVRRRTPVLPPAAHPEGMLGEGPHPIHLVVLGDSVAAGVGIPDHRRTVAGELARRLHLRHRRPVSWRVHATSGLDAGGVRDLVPAAREDLAVATVVLISVGVNDVKAMHSVRGFTRDLTALLDDVEQAAPHARVLLLGIPPMERFPALRGTLAWSMGGRARSLDRAGGKVVQRRERVTRIPLLSADLPASQGGFAEDGFHPGLATHEHFATKALVALEAAAGAARS